VVKNDQHSPNISVCHLEKLFAPTVVCQSVTREGNLWGGQRRKISILVRNVEKFNLTFWACDQIDGYLL